MTVKVEAALLVPLALLAIAGCSQQTVSSAGQDAQHNITVVDRQADALAKQARPQVDKLTLGARVTAALQANANLPSTIRVDAGTDGVRLRGTVRTEAQKALAGKVAGETVGPGKSVSNEITVVGTTP